MLRRRIRDRKEGKKKQEKENGEEELDREIPLEEVNRALAKMKNNNAAGEDGIVAEFLMYLPLVWRKELSVILNEVFKKG